MKGILGLTLGSFIFLTCSFVLAQETNKPGSPGFFVMSYNMVQMSDVGKVNALFDSVTLPILDELKSEGKLLGYGQLNHFWGDEWNVNVYYVTEDHASFVKFWEEFTKRVGQRFPGAFSKIVAYFQAHKDNMYFIRHMK